MSILLALTTGVLPVLLFGRSGKRRAATETAAAKKRKGSATGLKSPSRTAPSGAETRIGTSVAAKPNANAAAKKRDAAPVGAVEAVLTVCAAGRRRLERFIGKGFERGKVGGNWGGVAAAEENRREIG